MQRMNSPLRQTRSHLMALFQQEGLHPRGDLGQNFLIDPNIVRKILAVAELHAGDSVLEIGPGRGILTESLCHASGHVTAIEIDPRLGAKRALETLCHEQLHISLPHLSEREIDRLGKEVSETLWRQNYRQVLLQKHSTPVRISR